MKKFSLCCLSLMTITACGDATIGNLVPTATPNPANTTNSASLAALVGTWETGCVADKMDPQSFSTEVLKVDANYQATFTVSSYSSSQCAEADKTSLSNTVVTVSDGANSTTVTGAQNLTYTTVKVEMTWFDDQVVALMNSSKAFEYSDWQKGVSKDVTGKKASAADPTTPVSAGDKAYTLYNISGNTLKMVSEAKKTEAERPTSLDNATSFTKK